jgi:hypothetical protein
MRTVTRENFVNAIEAGMEAAGFAFEPQKIERLRKHGRTAEATVVHSFRQDEVNCPMVAVVGRGKSFSDAEWAFVFAYDAALAHHVVTLPGPAGPIQVVDA